MELREPFKSLDVLSYFSKLDLVCVKLFSLLERGLDILWVEETTKKVHKIIFLWQSFLILCVRMDLQVRSQFRVLLRNVWNKALVKIVWSLISLPLNEKSVSIEILAKELAHISYNSFVEHITSQSAITFNIRVCHTRIRYIEVLEPSLIISLVSRDIIIWILMEISTLTSSKTKDILTQQLENVFIRFIVHYF